MPITQAQIVNAKPRAKPYRLFDGQGLYVEIAPSGGRWWRFKYRINGKEKRLSLGVYPDVSLKAARDRLDDVRRLLASGGRSGGRPQGDRHGVGRFAVIKHVRGDCQGVVRQVFAGVGSGSW